MIVRETYPERALVVYAPRWRLAALALVSVAFVAIGVLIAQDSDAGADVIGLVGVAFFGAAGLYSLGRLVWTRPVLRVTSDGVTDGSVSGAVGFVPWSLIGGISVRRERRSTFLAFAVHDADELIAALPAPRRWVARVNAELHGSLINVPTVMLPRHPDDLIAEIGRFRPVDHTLNG